MLDPLSGPPRHVGPYRLLAAIGAGGMGEVYLARGPRPGAPLVAVKTVRPDLDIDHDFRVRFRREIAAARAVSGAGTAALLDGDADAPVPWLATEYVAGPSLAETVRRCGPLPAATVRALGAALARALAAVHAAHVLHRDFKPGNVLLTPEGPKLIDFGIAQAFDATALTAAGMIVGTPGFMAPEQIEGSHAVVPASDVFALGAVLGYAVSGRGPFDDQELASVIFRISRGDADLSAVPDELREVVAACLSPAPGDRPTAARLADLLLPGGAAASGVPWPAPVLSLFAEHREAVARCERAVAADSFAAAPTATGTPASTPRLPAPPAAAPAAPPPGTPATRRRWPWIVAAAVAATGITVGAVLLPEGGGTAGGGTAGGASKSPGEAGPRRATGIVTQYGDAGRTGEFGAGTNASDRPAGWRPWTVRRPGGMDDRGHGCVLAKSLLVCRDGKGSAAALDAATGERRWTSPGFRVGPDGLQGVQALPPESDGTRVYVPSERGAIAVDLASGAERWRKPMPRGTAVMGLTYAQGVVYTAEFGFADEAAGPSDARVRARRASDGRELWRSPKLPGKVVDATLVKDGRLYASLEGSGLVALSTKDGTVTRRAPGRTCQGVQAYRSSLLCWAHGAAGVRELDPVTLRQRRTLAPAERPALPPAVGDAGVLVVTTATPDADAPVTHRMSAYDWRTGRRLWRYGAPQGTTAVGLAGKRVLAVGTYEMWGRSTEDDVNSYRRKNLPQPKGGDAYDTASLLGAPLYVGGALFSATQDGRILSGYAP
ncbi:PQQ-binding-like beta-propeller repeat protein [Streptomyces sp. A1499]|uniref:serine/threonine-protein kinase n=1 Tax=Streptomyces sp. A1499 TaxID=2563104 RepID=UPI00109EABC9|nr:PQQ-binding-like beta-propeller repeat protein [Streptomyces sp. A1499]THC49590.1 serine/threonine-protein kinase [Streptomyces sp. A1499]